ncbi:MAG: RNA polymerase sigma factor [Candidatus Latescibacterota bacterium]
MQQHEQKKIFDAWLRDHKNLLFKVLRSYAFTPQDQEDLFQEVVIQVWRSVPNYKGDSAVTTWLYRVALYSAIAWSRQEKRHRDGKQALDGVEHVLMVKEDVQDHRLDWLYAQIRQLDEIDLSVMLLFLDGFRYKEMARILGISESHVGVKINRIKKYLMDQLKEVGDEF